MNEKQKILVIVGPTSSGKSALAVALAKKFNGEVISADSRQVYIGLNIGTGKVTKKEMGGVQHHLLDVASPKKKFSAGDFVARTTNAITEITNRKKLPIVAGGTGFYIDTLVGRIALPNVPPDLVLRKKLQQKTAIQLFLLLKKKDSIRARAMDTPSERNNQVRLIRAIEIASYKNMAQNRKATLFDLSHIFDILWIGINQPFNILEQKIAARLSQRLKRGMIAEAKRLHAAGLSYKRMEELGLEYRSLARFLQGTISRNELKSELNRDIRRYAKKQLSYWQRNTDIKWVHTEQAEYIMRLIDMWLNMRD